MAARVLGKLLDGKPSDGFAYYLMQPEIVERASTAGQDEKRLRENDKGEAV